MWGGDLIARHLGSGRNGSQQTDTRYDYTVLGGTGEKRENETTESWSVYLVVCVGEYQATKVNWFQCSECSGLDSTGTTGTTGKTQNGPEEKPGRYDSEISRECQWSPFPFPFPFLVPWEREKAGAVGACHTYVTRRTYQITTSVFLGAVSKARACRCSYS